jgi:hypothetical protein
MIEFANSRSNFLVGVEKFVAKGFCRNLLAVVKAFWLASYLRLARTAQEALTVALRMLGQI